MAGISQSPTPRTVPLDADTTGDGDSFIVTYGCTAYHFSPEYAAGSDSLLDAVRLTRARDLDAGAVVAHPFVGTTRLPNELVVAVDGATYRHISEYPTPASPADERRISDVFARPDGRYVALLDDSRGVVVGVAGLLRDAAEGRVEFLRL